MEIKRCTIEEKQMTESKLLKVVLAPRNVAEEWLF